MNEPRALDLSPLRRKNAPQCARCGDTGSVLLGPPVLEARRCQCAAGILPGVWVGLIHPDDWAAVAVAVGRKAPATSGGKNVAEVA